MMHLLRLASRRLALVASVVTGLISSAHADPMSDISTGIWKMKYGVTNAQIADPNWLNADSDGDGVKNEDEIAAGTNPFSAGSVAKITGITAGASTVDITFPTELRKYYVVQGTSSLTAGFTSTASVWLGTGVPKTLTVTKGTNKFFRVLVQDIDSDGDGASDWAETVAGYNPNNGADGGVTVLTNALASSDVVTVTVTNSSATQPLAGFAPVETGSITVSRGGPLKFHALTVNAQKSGTAIAGTDYDDPLPTLQSVTFPINVGEVVLPIKPMANSSRKTNVTAIVKALPGTNYTLGGKSSGSVVINPAGTANGTGLTGQYHNSSNSVYGPVAGAGNDQLDIFAGAAEMTRVDSTIDFNGIASITTGNPCTVTTVYSHGLTSGTPVVISGVTGGTFSVAINGTFAATVTGANTFTVASSCTVIPTSLQVASVCGLNVITAVSTTGNPCILTTKVPHGLTTGNAVAINWLNGGTFGSSVNATHIATVTGASTFTIPISCTASPSAAQLAVATLSGPSGVNGWGSTKGPTGMSSPATGGAWSVRWTGQVLPQYSETYTFDVRSNGSSKLWINGQLLVDRWATSVTVGEYTNTITLKAGTLYDIQIDYWMSAPIAGSTGNAEARLFWWSPSQTKQIIPQSRLFPAPASVADKFTAITSSSSATGYEGVPFSFFVTSPDIGATITYALAPDSGTLPNGLSLNVNTGEILGIPTASPQTRGTYNVAINATNVAAGTPTGSSIVDITIYPVGAVTREVLTATGPKVADIAIPSPAVTPVHDTISTVDDDTEYPNNTGERLRGYIVPPETGNYYFWIAANNAAELWISNDSEYVNRVKRASLTADSGQKVWNNAPTQQSGWMALVAGQKYYFEVLHNTGANVIDDYVSMGWCQDDIGTVPSTSTAPNPTGAATLIPNGGAPLQGYPLSGTVPGYIFQPYDYPVVTPPTGTLYASNLGPQTNAITSASGSANIQVNAAETQAILHFTYQNLGTPKTSYHLHVDTFTGDDLAVHPQGEIIFDIDDADQNPSEQTGDGGYIWTFSPVGTFTSAAQLREALHKGKVYLNIHSVGYPSGEIRGTLGLIDGSQTPPDASLYPEPAYTDIATNGAHAARFLNQATFGANPDDVAAVQATGFSSWINAQLALAPSRVSNEVVAGITSNINDLYPSSLFTNAWWKNSITAPDQLRQRLAFALSEIMVISWANDSGPLQRNGRILADTHRDRASGCRYANR